MRRVDFLIADTRRVSRNEVNTDGTYSISDDEILRYINDAQDRLQGLIANQRSISKIFLVEKIIPTVAGQDGYSLNDRLFYNKEINQVEFSTTGNLGEYTVIPKMLDFNRDTNQSGLAIGYYTRLGKIYVIPVLDTSAGFLRILFERTLDDVDIRRGKISVVTGLTSTGFTSFTMDTSADAYESGTPGFSTIDYVCVVSEDGGVKAYNIPVGSYVTGTNVLTPRAGFTFQTGETIAVNDYVVFGKYTTTHSQLSDECDRYLIHYAAYSLLHKDSSNDGSKEKELLDQIENDVVKSIARQTGELQFIPQYNEGEWY